jgi:hypothetical protein
MVSIQVDIDKYRIMPYAAVSEGVRYMSIYYNPQLMRLLNEERLQEVIRGRTAGRRIEDRPERAARRHGNRLADDCLVKASALGC